jgi:DNA-binding NarL/FixJ family response regulator
MVSGVNSASNAVHVLVICNDLYFRVHLESQVRTAGMLAVPIASAAAVSAVFSRSELVIRGAVVDLGWNGGDPIEAIATLRRAGAAYPILAFGPHVERDRLNAARDAGATAMPRSRFVRLYGEFLHALSLGLPWPGAEATAADLADE